MRRPSPREVLLCMAALAVLALVIWRVVVALRSDESRVKLVLAEVAECASERKYLSVIDYIDPDYRDEIGLTVVEIKQFIVASLRRAKSVEAEIVAVSPVEVEGDVAKVRVRARVVAIFPEGKLTLAGVYGATARPPGTEGAKGGVLYDVELKRYKSYFRCTRVKPVRAGPGR